MPQRATRPAGSLSARGRNDCSRGEPGIALVMTGWLSRGLVAIAVGAVLAFAVTVRVEQFDIQNGGAIVMLAGIGYLLVHLGLLGWERGWGAQPPPARPYESGRDVD